MHKHKKQASAHTHTRTAFILLILPHYCQPYSNTHTYTNTHKVDICLQTPMRSVSMAAFLSPSPQQPPRGYSTQHCVFACLCVCLCLCMCVYLRPSDSQRGIGVTACLLSNRLTNNLLRGIRYTEKGEDQLCPSVCLSFSFYHFIALCLPFFLFTHLLVGSSRVTMLLLAQTSLFSPTPTHTQTYTQP